MTKPRPLAVIRNRRLNSVALLVPLRSVQFSSVQFMLQTLKRTFITRGDAFHANAIYIIPHYGWMIFFIRVHAG